MDEEVLKSLTSIELKKNILKKAKNILSERKNTINGNNNCDVFNIIKNKENYILETGYEKNIIPDTTEKQNISLKNKETNFFTLQDFTNKYSKTCEMHNLNCDNVEYELLISFMNTFNNELKYQIKLNDNEDKQNPILLKMVNIFMDKIILCCSNPTIFLAQNNNNNSSLLDNEMIVQIDNFLKQIEKNINEDVLFKTCLSVILDKIFDFKPDPDNMASWISRQAFVDLIKVMLDESTKRYELCITYIVNLIKNNCTNLTFFQVDNVVVLIEIIQYAIIFLSEKKHNSKYYSFTNEKWFEDFKDLLQALKEVEWKIYLNQLMAVETFLTKKKSENTKNVFNEIYKQQIELSALKNSSYSKWFKIELPLSMSLFK
ncbi:conserved protein, unknown function [Hepatocystis sp. ex Piliocolobus tephrosceles]|nr:conserved protein, unknown function [Hepatocystis sp. ex Piliocolobus tephrosceles]